MLPVDFRMVAGQRRGSEMEHSPSMCQGVLSAPILHIKRLSESISLLNVHCRPRGPSTKLPLHPHPAPGVTHTATLAPSLTWRDTTGGPLKQGSSRLGVSEHAQPHNPRRACNINCSVSLGPVPQTPPTRSCILTPKSNTHDSATQVYYPTHCPSYPAPPPWLSDP